MIEVDPAARLEVWATNNTVDEAKSLAERLPNALCELLATPLWEALPEAEGEYQVLVGISDDISLLELENDPRVVV